MAHYKRQATAPDRLWRATSRQLPPEAGTACFSKTIGSLWGMGCEHFYSKLGDGTYNNTNRPERVAWPAACAANTGRKPAQPVSQARWQSVGYGLQISTVELGDGRLSNTKLPEQIVAGQIPPALGITTAGGLPVMVWPASATELCAANDHNLATGNWVTVTDAFL